MKNILFATFFIFCLKLFSQNYPIIEWVQTYSIGSGRSVIQTDDSDFIIVGYNSDNWYGGNLYYLKINSEGDEIWSVFGNSDEASANSISKTSNNEFYITGKLDNNNFLEKIDSNGNSLFFTSYDTEWYGKAIDIAQDSSMLICGDGVYGCAMKTDVSGNLIWEKTYPDESHIWGELLNSYCDDIKFLDDGNILIGGYYESWYVDEQFNSNYLLKTDGQGNEIWYREFPNSFSKNPSKFVLTPTNDYVVIGNRNEVYKISSDGNLIWSVDNCETSCQFTSIKSFVNETDIYYYIIGNVFNQEYSYPCMIKVDDNGNIIWEKVYEAESEAEIQIYDFVMTDDNGFLLAGTLNNQMYIVKLSSDDTEVVNEKIQCVNAQLFQNSPNPFNPSTLISFSTCADSEIELSIFNLKGQKIKELIHQNFTKGTHSVVWDGFDEYNNQVGSGLYCYKLISDKKVVDIKKCMLLK